MDQKRVDEMLELVGQQGCVQTRRIIAEMEGGLFPTACEDLSQAERWTLLQELREVMEVYGEACRIG